MAFISYPRVPWWEQEFRVWKIVSFWTINGSVEKILQRPLANIGLMRIVYCKFCPSQSDEYVNTSDWMALDHTPLIHGQSMYIFNHKLQPNPIYLAF